MNSRFADIGVVASLLLERGRPRLRTWRDLARATGYPVVGRIPPSRALKRGLAAAFSDLRTASAFRILRANLEPQLRARGRLHRRDPHRLAAAGNGDPGSRRGDLQHSRSGRPQARTADLAHVMNLEPARKDGDTRWK